MRSLHMSIQHRGARASGGPPPGGADFDNPPFGVGGSTELRAQLFGSDAAAPTTAAQDVPPPVCVDCVCEQSN